tara:strand:- start:243 stop:482 length:240 start_codon:yes stop_codon:yes gene_type:complete
MVKYEETYCKLLTGEYTGSESVIKMALDYASKQIKIHRQVLDELKDDCIDYSCCEGVVSDYYKYINAILTYKNGIHIPK